MRDMDDDWTTLGWIKRRRRPRSSHKKKSGNFSSESNINLQVNTYVMETDRQLGKKRKLSISFDESDLGREKTMTAIVYSHEKGLAAWLVPKVFPAPKSCQFSSAVLQDLGQETPHLPLRPTAPEHFSLVRIFPPKRSENDSAAAINSSVYSKKHRKACQTTSCEARHICR